MDEIEFRNWLSQGATKKKVQGDCISRLKRVESALEIDLDKEYKKDKLEKVLKALSKRGCNEIMTEYGDVDLPIGKYYMSTYRHSLKEYVKFKNK